MYNDFYNQNPITPSIGNVDETWLIISAVLALIGGVVAYILFVSNKDTKEYSGFVSWLHRFLNFKVFFIEMILKVLYMVSAIFITLGSFSLIRVSIASFFLSLILGNVVVRISYEFVLMFLTLVSNTTEINKKIGLPKKENEKPSPKVKRLEEIDGEKK